MKEVKQIRQSRPLDRVLIKEIEDIVKQTPNDQELGSKIRDLVKFGNIMGI